MLNVLLIEDDSTACQNLVKAFDKKTNMTLVDYTNSSYKAIELVQSIQPDVIILDLELHEGEGSGIEFLCHYNKLNLAHPAFILVTTFNISKMTHQRIRQLGADFILSKGQENYAADSVVSFLETMIEVISVKDENAAPKSLASNLEKVTSTSEKETADIKILRELDYIGIAPNALGRKYLLDSILLVSQDFSGKLYAEVAKKYDKTPPSVERAMQNAIEKAWKTTDIYDLETYYTARVSSTRGIPTIMEFIYYYAEKIKNNSIAMAS